MVQEGVCSIVFGGEPHSHRFSCPLLFLSLADGEMVPFCEELYPTGNVEDWLLEVERVMKSSLKAIIRDSLVDYSQVRGVLDVCPGHLVIVLWDRRACVHVLECVHLCWSVYM